MCSSKRLPITGSRQGLAALTINWGALSGAGFVARNEKTAAYLDAIGMKSINIDEALRVIRRMLQHETPQVLASRADWNLWQKLIDYVGASNTFERVSREQGEEASGGSIGPRVMAAPPEATRSDDHGLYRRQHVGRLQHRGSGNRSRYAAHQSGARFADGCRIDESN